VSFNVLFVCLMIVIKELCQCCANNSVPVTVMVGESRLRVWCDLQANHVSGVGCGVTCEKRIGGSTPCTVQRQVVRGIRLLGGTVGLFELMRSVEVTNDDHK
jgi:hypothetical protein